MKKLNLALALTLTTLGSFASLASAANAQDVCHEALSEVPLWLALKGGASIHLSKPLRMPRGYGVSPSDIQYPLFTLYKRGGGELQIMPQVISFERCDVVRYETIGGGSGHFFECKNTSPGAPLIEFLMSTKYGTEEFPKEEGITFSDYFASQPIQARNAVTVGQLKKFIGDDSKVCLTDKQVAAKKAQSTSTRAVATTSARVRSVSAQ